MRKLAWVRHCRMGAVLNLQNWQPVNCQDLQPALGLSGLELGLGWRVASCSWQLCLGSQHHGNEPMSNQTEKQAKCVSHTNAWTPVQSIFHERNQKIVNLVFFPATFISTWPVMQPHILRSASHCLSSRIYQQGVSILGRCDYRMHGLWHVGDASTDTA
jgi:hypothetical protein